MTSLPDLFAHLPMRPRLMVATPARDHVTATEQQQALHDVEVACVQQGVDYVRSTFGGSSLLALVRNKMTDAFLRSESTHLLFIDADIVADAGDVLALLASGHPLVGLACSRRQIDWRRIVDAAVSAPEYFKSNPQRLSEAGAVYNFTWPEADSVVVERGFAKVAHVGTGCVLVAREVLEALAARAPRVRVSDDDGGEDRHVPWIWDFGVEGDMYLGEDVRFCRAAAALGYEPRILVSASTSHVGLFAYRCNVLADLNREAGR